ncbi:hypothetical protein BJ165DRAFT_1474399 [Panaeolus papilionaceus]|nr:hypothetical protein BJ165DRAFT_1474399 [Panaeolus papilionaceus]
MSLSSPVFAHSTDEEDSMDNDSILDGPRKTWGERGDRKGYRYGGYHSSGPMKAKEKERDETGNDTTTKPVQATAAASSQQTQSSQPVQPVLAGNTHPTPSRPAPPPPQSSKGASSTRTVAPSTPGRKKEEEKGEWIVLDMGSEHGKHFILLKLATSSLKNLSPAFHSILRIFHRHFPPPISSSFTPYLEAFTAAMNSPVISKDPVEKSTPAPGPIDRSANASLRTVETSAASINDNSINTIPSLSLAVPYPEWRLGILSKARTHGMRDVFRPLDLASRGCAPESEDNEASNLRKHSDAKVSSKAYAHLRRMSAQSRGVFSPASSRRKSKLGPPKRARKHKLRTKASHISEGDADRVTVDDGSISISVSQDDAGSLAYEDGDVDEADEYDEDEDDEDDDDDDQSFAPSHMDDPSASLSKRMDRLDDGLFDASDADSRLGVHDDNVFSLESFEDSDEESELEWMAWVSDIPRQVALKSDGQLADQANQAKSRSNVMLRKPQSSVTLFSNPFGGSSIPYLPTDLHQDSWIPKIHAEEMRLVAENRRRLEPSAVGMSRSSSEAYGQSISTAPSTYHYGYPYYSDMESSPREKPLDIRVQQAHYASDTPSYGSQPIDIVRDPTDVYGSHNAQRRQSSSSIESLSITRYHDRINASNITRNQSPDSPIYGSPPARDHMQDYDDIPPVPPVPDEYLSQSPRSPTFTGASPSKSSTTTTPRHVRKHSRSLSGAIGSPHGSHPPLSPSSKQASGLYHSASFHTPTRNEVSGLSSSRPDMPILSPEQISRIERETDEKMSGATSSIYASSSRGGLSVYDSYSASTGSRTANTSSVSVNNPYGYASSSAYSQMFDGPPVRVKVEQATTTTSSALHASTSYPSMASAARTSQASTPSNPTSAAANVLQSAGRGIVSLIHGNLMPRRSSSAGLLGKPNPAQPATPQEGPSVTFANSPASSLGRSPSYRIKAQGMADKDKGPNVLRKRLSDLNRERPPIPAMSSSPPNPNLMSPRQRPKLSLPGIHNSPPPRDVAEPTSPRLQQARSPTSTTMGINSPLDSSAGPWSTVDSSEQIHQSVVGAVQVPGSSNQSSNAMASARALLRRVRSGSSLHTPMGMHMEEPGSPETPYGVNNLSRSP